MENIDFSIDQNTKQAILSDPFDFCSTLNLAHNYLKLPPNGGIYSHKAHFFGLFSGKEFSPRNGKAGIRLWYCLKKGNAPFPKFFLAIEQIDYYNPDDPEEETTMDEWLIVPKVGGYWNRRVEREIVKDFLKSNIFRSDFPSGNRISKKKVLEYSTNFKEYISGLPKNGGATPDPYCKYCIAYFRFNSDYHTFFNQNQGRIAFFMGYTQDSYHFPNYLRPILACINSVGSVITGATDCQSINTSKTFLQASWPPPPNN